MGQVHLGIGVAGEADATGAGPGTDGPSTGDDELENESLEDILEERLAEAEGQLEKALERIDRLETLLDAMGIPEGFGREYVLSSVCQRHALRALKHTSADQH
jgi:hypothetical protein